jgi:hypothetical protein
MHEHDFNFLIFIDAGHHAEFHFDAYTPKHPMLAIDSAISVQSHHHHQYQDHSQQGRTQVDSEVQDARVCQRVESFPPLYSWSNQHQVRLVNYVHPPPHPAFYIHNYHFENSILLLVPKSPYELPQYFHIFFSELHGVTVAIAKDWRQVMGFVLLADGGFEMVERWKLGF